MTDSSAEPTPPADGRHFVFTTTGDDALALEDILKPANRGWRSMLGYLIALPPLVVISFLTQNSEWQVWFFSFGAAGVVAWQAARFILRLERQKAALAHPVGSGDIVWSGNRLTGTVAGTTFDLAAADVRLEKDGRRLHILSKGKPALILPLAAFDSAADLAAFAAAVDKAGRRP